MKHHASRIAGLLLAGGLLSCGGAMAACRQISQAEIDEWTGKTIPVYKSDGTVDRMFQHLDFNVTFPASIEVEPDLALGETFASGSSDAVPGYYAIASCDRYIGGITRWQLAPGLQPTSFPGVVASPLPGIGMRLNYVRADGRVSVFPFASPYGPQPKNPPIFPTVRPGLRMVVDLVKTGEMNVMSTLPAANIGTGKGDGDGISVVDVRYGSTRIQVKTSCRASTPAQNIDFGTFGPADVSETSGPTRPIDFAVTCIGPASPSSITMKLTGTPDIANPALLRNTGAQHLGIRVRDIPTGTVLRPNDTSSQVVTAGGLHEYAYRLDATVLRTGAQPPTSGTISATAVLTLAVR